MSRESIVTLITLVSAVGGAVFSFNYLVLPYQQSILKDELKTHIEVQFTALRGDLKAMPTHADVENARLKAMLASAEKLEFVELDNRRKFAMLESQVEEIKRGMRSQ